jgi:SAM-dependent methyltransferase
MDQLSRVSEFWDTTPCDGQPDYARRARFRYRKEPWLPVLLDRIASSQRNVLEIGCGQGTDGVTLCRLLPPGSRYVGVDISPASLERARSAATDMGGQLKVQPTFEFQNAEQLGFDSGTFDCVLSVGALHHSADTERAIAEAWRVLKPDGVAFVLLYRTWSPKLLAAHSLRTVQRALDLVLGTDRICYRTAYAWKLGDDRFGTMVYECFGVPILRSYTRNRMRQLLHDFSSVQLTAQGFDLLPHATTRWFDRPRNNPLGYLWLAEARK